MAASDDEDFELAALRKEALASMKKQDEAAIKTVSVLPITSLPVPVYAVQHNVPPIDVNLLRPAAGYPYAPPNQIQLDIRTTAPVPVWNYPFQTNQTSHHYRGHHRQNLARPDWRRPQTNAAVIRPSKHSNNLRELPRANEPGETTRHTDTRSHRGDNKAFRTETAKPQLTLNLPQYKWSQPPPSAVVEQPKKKVRNRFTRYESSSGSSDDSDESSSSEEGTASAAKADSDSDSVSGMQDDGDSQFATEMTEQGTEENQNRTNNKPEIVHNKELPRVSADNVSENPIATMQEDGVKNVALKNDASLPDNSINLTGQKINVIGSHVSHRVQSITSVARDSNHSLTRNASSAVELRQLDNIRSSQCLNPTDTRQRADEALPVLGIQTEGGQVPLESCSNHPATVNAADDDSDTLTSDSESAKSPLTAERHRNSSSTMTLSLVDQSSRDRQRTYNERKISPEDFHRNYHVPWRREVPGNEQPASRSPRPQYSSPDRHPLRDRRRTPSPSNRSPSPRKHRDAPLPRMLSPSRALTDDRNQRRGVRHADVDRARYGRSETSTEKLHASDRSAPGSPRHADDKNVASQKQVVDLREKVLSRRRETEVPKKESNSTSGMLQGKPATDGTQSDPEIKAGRKEKDDSVSDAEKLALRSSRFGQVYSTNVTEGNKVASAAVKLPDQKEADDKTKVKEILAQESYGKTSEIPDGKNKWNFAKHSEQQENAEDVDDDSVVHQNSSEREERKKKKKRKKEKKERSKKKKRHSETEDKTREVESEEEEGLSDNQQEGEGDGRQTMHSMVGAVSNSDSDSRQQTGSIVRLHKMHNRTLRVPAADSEDSSHKTVFSITMNKGGRDLSEHLPESVKDRVGSTRMNTVQRADRQQPFPAPDDEMVESNVHLLPLMSKRQSLERYQPTKRRKLLQVSNNRGSGSGDLRELLKSRQQQGPTDDMLEVQTEPILGKRRRRRKMNRT